MRNHRSRRVQRHHTGRLFKLRDVTLGRRPEGERRVGPRSRDQGYHRACRVHLGAIDIYVVTVVGTVDAIEACDRADSGPDQIHGKAEDVCRSRRASRTLGALWTRRTLRSRWPLRSGGSYWTSRALGSRDILRERDFIVAACGRRGDDVDRAAAIVYARMDCRRALCVSRSGTEQEQYSEECDRRNHSGHNDPPFERWQGRVLETRCKAQVSADCTDSSRVHGMPPLCVFAVHSIRSPPPSLRTFPLPPSYTGRVSPPLS